MSNKEISKEKPYERFVTFGAESLTDAELLAIILRIGIKGCDAVELSRKVLELGKYPRTGFLGIYDTDVDTLEKISGIGKVKAIKLKALAEVSRRMHEARVSEGLNVKNASSVAEYYMERMRHNKFEKVILLSIDSRGKILRESEISIGSVNKALVSVRSILMEALNAEAVNLILMHNHPSGDPSPSKDDNELTAKLFESCKLMEIPLLDHIIIGDNVYYSYNESGVLR